MTQPGLEHNSSSASSTNETKVLPINHLQNHYEALPTTKPANSPASSPPKSPNCDILLNTFQIKKKRYRVLLNNDHIVWEAFHLKQNAGDNEKTTQKETEYESEQLSYKAAYGVLSNVVHINEIIRVSKGNTKSAATRVKATTQTQQPPGQETPMPQQPQQVAQSPQYSTPPTEQYLCIHYAEHVIASPSDCNRWRIRSLTLYNNDAYIVRQWHSVLNKKLESLQPKRVKRLLVFINPYGGRKQGLQTYEQHCKPLFQLADIDPSCIISQRANQIRDILMTHDLQQYDAVCCVGGDGTVAEVINGLLFRAMRDNQVDFLNPPYIPKPFLPVGIIPAGSTDTIAYSLHGTSDVRTAAIHLILGQRRGLDISSVRNRNGIVRFCASVLSYGYLGDVAAKSEKYRWMGTKRYEYTGVKAFLMNRGYEAEMRILLPDDEEQQPASSSSSVINQSGLTTPPNTPDSLCFANCQRCSLASTLISRLSENRQSFTDCQSDEDEDLEKSKTNDFSNRTAPLRSSNIFKDPDEPDRIDDSLNCDSNLMQNVLDKENLYKEPPAEAYNKEASNVPSSPSVILRNDTNLTYSNNNLATEKWKVIKGHFFMISGANITCACSRSPNGISRFCHLGDGYLDLILVRKTSLLNNVRFLINTMGKNGDIRNLPFVEVYRTRRFSFRTQHSNENEAYSLRGSCQPIAEDLNDDDNVSRWNCDGEVVNDLEITMSSHCQLVDVFMRGPSPYQKPPYETKRSVFCCCRST